MHQSPKTLFAIRQNLNGPQVYVYGTFQRVLCSSPCIAAQPMDKTAPEDPPAPLPTKCSAMGTLDQYRVQVQGPAWTYPGSPGHCRPCGCSKTQTNSWIYIVESAKKTTLHRGISGNSDILPTPAGPDKGCTWSNRPCSRGTSQAVWGECFNPCKIGHYF